MAKLATKFQKNIVVHDWEHKIKLIYNKMETEFSKYNVQLIKKYDREMVTEGLGKSSRFLHLNRLLSLTRRLKKDWKDVKTKDVKNVIFEIMDTYSDDGKETEYTYDHKKVLKIFFRWFKLGHRSYNYCLKKKRIGDPPETEDIIMKKPKSRLKADDLITDQDREWILDACVNSRDRALIDVGLDGGLRPGELLSLRIKNVMQDKRGFMVNVDGKTGIRPVRLIVSTASLSRWLAEHPFKEDTNFPLWIVLEKTKYGQPLAYSAARAILSRITDRVKEKHPEFNKRLFLNIFRHTEATKTAKFMAHGITKKRHGWSANSKMPDRYSHLVSDDVDEVIFKHYGIESEEDEQKTPRKCHVCKMINSVDSKMCSQCGRPLSLDEIVRIDEEDKREKEETKSQMNTLMQKVEVLQEKVKDLNFIKRSEEKILFDNRKSIPGFSMWVKDPKKYFPTKAEKDEFSKKHS